MNNDFEHWWEHEGQFSYLCGKELCAIAWSNGAYKAINEKRPHNSVLIPCDKLKEMQIELALLKKEQKK